MAAMASPERQGLSGAFFGLGGSRHRLAGKPAARGSVFERRLLPTLFEISQIGGRLVLARGHQVAIATDEIVLLADLNMGVALARKIRPDRLWVRVAQVLLVDGPWPRQGVINNGDLVMKYVGVRLIEKDALLEDRLVVVV